MTNPIKVYKSPFKIVPIILKLSPENQFSNCFLSSVEKVQRAKMVMSRLIWLFQLISAARYRVWPDCSASDITVIMDGSKSITEPYFEMIRLLALQTMRLGYKENYWNRYAVMQFSHGKNELYANFSLADQFGYAEDPEINLGTFVNKEKNAKSYLEAVTETIDDRKIYHSGWQTRTQSALKFARQNIIEYGDRRRKQIVVLISDGNRHDWPRSESDSIKEFLRDNFLEGSQIVGILAGPERSEDAMRSYLGSDVQIFEGSEIVPMSPFLEEDKNMSAVTVQALIDILCGNGLPETTTTTTTRAPTTTTTTPEPTTTVTTTTQTPCPARADSECFQMDSYTPICERLDISFVIDSSSSVSISRWVQALDFINWVVMKSHAMNVNTRYSLFQFSSGSATGQPDLNFDHANDNFQFSNNGQKFSSCDRAEDYKLNFDSLGA